LRVGLLTTSYPRHAGDYAGSFVADRVHALLAAGHSVEVLAAGDGGPLVDGRLLITRVPGGPRLFYGAGAPEMLEWGGAAWWEAARFSAELATRARARAAEWDAVESHWLVPCALAGSAAAPTRTRSAYAHSGDVALLERIPLGRAIARRLARDGTQLRFVSQALRDRFAFLCGESVGTVESLPLPAALFSARAGPDGALRRRFGLTAPTILAVGRLVPIKGHGRLLRACARLSAGGGGDQPQVVILGDGPERDRLERLAAAASVSLRLPGFVPRAEVAAWLRAADVYVQPSIRLANGRTEGTPIATREARAIGIPVVIFDDVERLARALADQLSGRNRNVNAV